MTQVDARCRLAQTSGAHVNTRRRILVPLLDIEATSSAAISKATQLAHATGATVELFHALKPPLHGVAAAYADSTAQLVAQARTTTLRRLTAIAERWRQTGVDVEISTAVDYPAYEAIIRRALKSDAGLVVLDGHARHRFARFLQLTDWELLRHCPVPVLIVRRAEGYIEPTVLAAIDPTHARAKPSGLDHLVLGQAEQFAQYLHGNLHIVHAVPPMVVMDPNKLVDGELLARAQLQAHESAAAKVAQLMTRSRVKPGQVYLVDSRPRKAIADVARRSAAQILVMGVVSRSALGRILIGSTAEAVLDDIDCDVLLVKPRDFRSGISLQARRGVQRLPAS